jgi:hypothetical protein
MKKLFLVAFLLFALFLVFTFVTKDGGLFHKNEGTESESTNTPVTEGIVSDDTITVLPEYPGVPLGVALYSDAKKKEIVKRVIDSKLSTYPKVSSKPYRVAKHSGSGLATQVELRDDQLKILATNYDYNQLPPMQRAYGETLKKYAPDFKLFMYFDAGIQPEENLDIVGDDAGNVDAENIAWILDKHPDWLLHDAEGNPLVSAKGTLSNAGEYWGDPGNSEYQEWFAGKINKAMEQSGNIWDGVLLDQFFGKIENYTGYAGTNPQTRYKTNTEYQSAQLSFLKRLSELVRVPVIANLDGAASLEYPQFFVQVGKTAGGIETEIYPFENSDENDSSLLPSDSLKGLIDGINQLPKNKYVKIASKPGGMEGNTPRTLYAYYSYLLVADKDRQIYWSSKEGDSSVPHYWYKEYDLDLGDAKGSADTSGTLWTRTFTNGTLYFNPQRNDESTRLSSPRYTLWGKKIEGTVSVPAHSGILLFDSLEQLETAKKPLKI